MRNLHHTSTFLHNPHARSFYRAESILYNLLAGRLRRREKSDYYLALTLKSTGSSQRDVAGPGFEYEL